MGITDTLPWEGAPAPSPTASPAAERAAEERTALEARAGLESLEDLQARRRALAEEYATLSAMHGSNGHWDAHRRALRGEIGDEIRRNWADTKAPSEAVVEDRACAHQRYQQLLARGLQERIRYQQLELEFTEIAEKIKSRELELAAYTAELRHAR